MSGLESALNTSVKTAIDTCIDVIAVLCPLMLSIDQHEIVLHFIEILVAHHLIHFFLIDILKRPTGVTSFIKVLTGKVLAIFLNRLLLSHLNGVRLILGIIHFRNYVGIGVRRGLDILVTTRMAGVSTRTTVEILC